MIAIKTISRACAGCTMCCQGWLTGKAWGHSFYPGQPCGWLGTTGCTIYQNRPKDPCQTFECLWKRDLILPDWLRPDKSGVIMKWSVLDSWSFIIAVARRKNIDARIHDWANNHANQFKVNMIVPTHSGTWKIYSNDQTFRDRAAEIYIVSE